MKCVALQIAVKVSLAKLGVEKVELLLKLCLPMAGGTTHMN